MRWIVGTVLFVGMLATAHAEALPATDSEKYCKATTAMFADSMREQAFKTCMDAESQDKIYLTKTWSIVPPETQKSCISVQSFVAATSYQGLLGCAAMSVGVACLQGAMACH